MVNAIANCGPAVTIKVCVFEDNGVVIAQCLDHAIAAQGKTHSETLKAFEQIVTGQIILDMQRGREALKAVPPVPQYCLNEIPSGATYYTFSTALQSANYSFRTFTGAFAAAA